MNFTAKDYLANSEKRIEHLREIIAGRPVAILAAGPSVQELEKRIGDLRNADICYFGFNNFSLPETHILQQIDKHFSVTMCSAREHMANYIKSIKNFLNRNDNNIFISSFWRDTFELMSSDFDLNQFLCKYNSKLIFFSLSWERIVPNDGYPLHFIVSNSLLILIELAIIGKASKIVLFGADGYCNNTNKQYYLDQSVCDDIRSKSVIDDTNSQFNPIAPLALRNVYRTYNIAQLEILNCSEDSVYTPFPKVSYNEAFNCLLTGKKFRREMDLRIPKVSIISLCSNTGGFLKETIENISKQSYANYEHVVIYNDNDAKIRDLERQYQNIRWNPEKNTEYIPSLKKAISMARGDYIFQCNIGNSYLNQDWVNTCVEVLENNPDISLVWGLSQNDMPERISDAGFSLALPAQGKNYIYYWLKKKTLFHEGNFCVRKKVLEECFPFLDKKVDEREAWLVFNYRFNVSGYQPYFVPVAANYYRTQGGTKRQSPDPIRQNLMKDYYRDIEEYKRQLIAGKIVHRYRTNSGELSPDGFNFGIFLFFDIGRYIKSKLPIWCLWIIEKVLYYWKNYKWKFLNIVTVKIWRRLIKILIQPNLNTTQ